MTVPLPSPGFGTFQLDDPDECTAAVRSALDVGYRHVDTAARYHNEAAVGEAIAASDVPRAELFLATKILHPRLTKTADHDDVVDAALESLDRLGVSSVELLYVHWPFTYDLETVFDAFRTLAERGVMDHVGVCNFTAEQLSTALDLYPDIAVNQVEMHPLLPQDELRAFAAEADVSLVAHTPLLRGEVGTVPELRTIADHHGVSPAQVSLAWLRSKGVTPVPKAAGRDHQADNWASRTLDLDASEIATIDDIDRERRFVDPDFAPDW